LSFIKYKFVIKDFTVSWKIITVVEKLFERQTVIVHAIILFNTDCMYFDLGEINNCNSYFFLSITDCIKVVKILLHNIFHWIFPQKNRRACRNSPSCYKLLTRPVCTV